MCKTKSMQQIPLIALVSTINLSSCHVYTLLEQNMWFVTGVIAHILLHVNCPHLVTLWFDGKTAEVQAALFKVLPLLAQQWYTGTLKILKTSHYNTKSYAFLLCGTERTWLWQACHHPEGPENNWPPAPAFSLPERKKLQFVRKQCSP